MADLQTLTFKGQVTATSNKTYKGRPADETSRKTAYVTVSDSQDIKKLEDFGLTKYTSKEDNVDFFIIKMSKEITLYRNGETPTKLDTSLTSNNFTTNEVELALTKGEVDGKDFYRLFAINTQSDEDIQDIEATNPFA